MNILVRKIKNDWTQMPGGLTWYFIGSPKTGKTTQASKWHKEGSKKVILIDTDLGADFVDGANIIPVVCLEQPTREMLENGKPVFVTEGNKKQQVFEPIPPEERGYYYRSGKDKGKPMPVFAFYEVLSWLRNEWNTLPYDAVAIDTIDKVNEWVEASVVKELKIDNIADAEWGAGWNKAKNRVARGVEALQDVLRKAGSDLIMTSHSKPSSVQDGKVQLAPDLPKGLAGLLTGKADVIGYTTASKTDGKYYVSFFSYDERAVGSRLEPLRQKRLPFDYNAVVEELKTYKKKEA